MHFIFNNLASSSIQLADMRDNNSSDLEQIPFGNTEVEKTAKIQNLNGFNATDTESNANKSKFP